MIEVTRINDSKLWINALLIKTIEETPDTIITLTTGEKWMVRESAALLAERIQAFYQHLNMNIPQSDVMIKPDPSEVPQASTSPS